MPRKTTIAIVLALTSATPTAQSRAEAPNTIWGGVFTKAQADRGSEPYSERCGTCHGQTGRGGPDAPGIVGYSLEEKWADVPLVAYYTFVSDQMPKGRARSLSPQTYIDIVAHLLSLHGAPAGNAELSPDDGILGEIMITAKPNK